MNTLNICFKGGIYKVFKYVNTLYVAWKYSSFELKILWTSRERERERENNESQKKELNDLILSQTNSLYDWQEWKIIASSVVLSIGVPVHNSSFAPRNLSESFISS